MYLAGLPLLPRVYRYYDVHIPLECDGRGEGIKRCQNFLGKADSYVYISMLLSETFYTDLISITREHILFR